MPSRPRLALAALGLVVVAYLGFLQYRAWDREPPLLVTWTSGVAETTVRNPVTGRAGWGTREDVTAFLGRVHDARGWRATEDLRADADTFSVRVVEVRGHRVALVEAPKGAIRQLPALPPAELTLVATVDPPVDVLAALPGPVVVLPGAYGAGVADGGEVSGGDHLVAPWVDSRYRVGVLHVRFEPTISVTGTAVDLPLREVPEGTPSRLGVAPPGLTHDVVRLGDSGLGKALSDAVLTKTGADVSLINYFALRAPLEGEIDLARLEKALPFHNEVVLQTFSTAQLRELLKEGADPLTTHFLIVASREPLPDPLPERDWRVATVDYLANGGRGGWPLFTEGRDRVRTRITLDSLAIALLEP